MNNSKVTFDEKADKDIELEYLREENMRLRLQVQNAMTYIKCLHKDIDDLKENKDEPVINP